MPHARHVGFYFYRPNHGVITPIGRYVNPFQLALQRMPSHSPSRHASIPHRKLSLASTAPITFSKDRKTISFKLNDGSVLSQKFAPTPKANLDRLSERLPDLLRTPERPPAIEIGNESKRETAGISFGAAEWSLDSDGDAIHRHVAFAQVSDIDTIERLILQEADELNHHPHVIRGKSEDGGERLMTITCTTHSPQGLSVRDTRLAEKINEILAEVNTIDPWSVHVHNQDDVGQKIAAERKRMIVISREKINVAVKGCGCEGGKPTAPAQPA